MYCVYWIHMPNQHDPLCEGYIGLTKNLPERLRGHRKNKKQTPLTKLLAKSWSSVVIEVLDSNLSREEACQLEAYYRPAEHIGLNLLRGGNLGVQPEWYSIAENREQHRKATSKATKRGIRLKDTTEARRIRAAKSYLNPNRKSSAHAGSNNGKAALTEKDIPVIRERLAKGEPTAAVARVYSVVPYAIYAIKIGKTWKHV